MSKSIVTMRDFAVMVYDLLKSDRDVVTGVGGFTGEGKSTFSLHFSMEYAKVTNKYFSFSRMTWDRDELLTWIDGKPKSEKGENGLREGQIPEFEPIIAEELFYMFYKRNWFEKDQISAVAVFNSCRDRHLPVTGNIPDLWDLDSSFIKRIRFYVYIPERGRAWVFMQENNPFNRDPWNVAENRKIFRDKKNPYSIPNFVCEIHFEDLSPEQKTQYLDIRNTKRVLALNKSKQKQERYVDIKEQRDSCISAWYNDRCDLSGKLKKVSANIKKLLAPWLKPPTNETIADSVGISKEAIRLIRIGER